jgi:proteasome lid subunit RPN8/RPN11
MKIRGIRKNLLALLLELGREHHPSEYVALLREKDGIINEVDLLPGTVGREDSASLYLDMMPLDIHVTGSAHSHPNGVLRPSDADIRFFPRTGRFHFIVGYPYQVDNWRCFRSDGTPEPIEVIG